MYQEFEGKSLEIMMTLKDCYNLIGGDYDSVTSRFGGERLVFKYAYKFLEDASFQNLTDMLEIKNVEEAFRAAHTIKGICQNLSFDRLGNSSSLLTEALRAGNLPQAVELYPKVKEDYILTKDTLEQLKEENSI